MNRLAADTEPVSFTFLEVPKSCFEAMQSRPPSISAFQSFETSLFLISLQRFPHALVSLVSALESAALVVLGGDSRDKIKLAEALPALRELALHAGVSIPDTPTLSKLRNTRNDIAHKGFSAKDDERSAFLWLRLGFPLFQGWSKELFGLDLYTGLGRLGDLLKQPIEWCKEPRDFNFSAVDATRGVRHWITHNVRYSHLSEWEQDVLSFEHEARDRAKQYVFDRLTEDEPHVLLTCPICSARDGLVVAVNETQLKQRQLVPDYANCASCDMQYPPSSRELLIAMCREQLTSDLTHQTCKAYGIRADSE